MTPPVIAFHSSIGSTQLLFDHIRRIYYARRHTQCVRHICSTRRQSSSETRSLESFTTLNVVCHKTNSCDFRSHAFYQMFCVYYNEFILCVHLSLSPSCQCFKRNSVKEIGVEMKKGFPGIDMRKCVIAIVRGETKTVKLSDKRLTYGCKLLDRFVC